MGTEGLLLYSDYYSGVFMLSCHSSILRQELSQKPLWPLTHMKFFSKFQHCDQALSMMVSKVTRCKLTQ